MNTVLLGPSSISGVTSMPNLENEEDASAAKDPSLDTQCLNLSESIPVSHRQYSLGFSV